MSFFERHFGAGLTDFDRERLRLHRVPGCDHTIRPLFAQDRFFQLVRAALERITKANVLKQPRSRQAFHGYDCLLQEDLLEFAGLQTTVVGWGRRVARLSC